MFGKNIWLLASVGVVGISGPAIAQESSSDAEDALVSSDIIVTARRRDEVVQDVPAVVNAVTADAMAKLNLRKFEDVTSVVPGLSVSTARSSAGVQSTLRGINFNSNVSGFNGTVEYYMNDGLINSAAITYAMFDLAQVEVLRGPQGTLRGRASPSGAINVATRRPNMAEVGFVADATITNLNGYQLSGAFNLPVIADKLAVRVAGVTSRDEGNRITEAGTGRGGHSKTNGIRASVSADPLDGILLLDFTYQGISRQANIFSQVEAVNQLLPTAAPSPVTIRAKDRLAIAGIRDNTETNADVYNWQAQLNLAGQRLTYVGLKFEGEFTSLTPQDEAGIFAVDEFNGTPFILNNRTLTNTTSHEVRMQNDQRIGGIIDYVVGALIYDASSHGNVFRPTALGALNPGRLTGMTIANQIRVNNSSEKSIFGNVTVHPVEGMELSGGLRRIWYKSDAGMTQDGVPVAALDRHIKERATIYSASAKYRFTDDIMAYANFGTSWRPSSNAPGGPNLPSPLQDSFINGPAETSKSYEAGIKTEFFDKRLLLNVSGYYQKFKNYPYRSPSPVYAIDRARGAVVGFNYLAPVPVTVKGVEAEFNFTILDNWKVGGVVSYTDGKITGGSIPCLDLDRNDIPDVVNSAPSMAALEGVVGNTNISACPLGSKIPANLSAPWSGALTTEYVLPIHDDKEAYLRGLYSWNGHSENDPANAFDRVKGHGLLNLYLGLRDVDGAWELSVFGKNITNTYRVLSRSNGPLATITRNIGTISDTNYFGIVSTPPREFGVNFRVVLGSR